MADDWAVLSASLWAASRVEHWVVLLVDQMADVLADPMVLQRVENSAASLGGQLVAHSAESLVKN